MRNEKNGDWALTSLQEHMTSDGLFQGSGVVLPRLQPLKMLRFLFAPVPCSFDRYTS